MRLFSYFLLFALSAPLARGDGQTKIKMDDTCSVTVPPGSKSQPTPEWYAAFKKNIGDSYKQASDGDRWKGPDHKEFDACAAFQVLLGIGWKESQLNPGITGDLNQPYHAHGLFQIQQRNCSGDGKGNGGVGVSGNLNDPVTSVTCAARIMARNFKKYHCVTLGADQKGNGKCLTNWSTMICQRTAKYGKREPIRGVAAKDTSCQ